MPTSIEKQPCQKGQNESNQGIKSLYQDDIQAARDVDFIANQPVGTNAEGEEG
jgi:hypothetical protein